MGVCMSNKKLAAPDVRRVAVEAKCDPRTVVAFIDGKSVRGEPVRAGIAAALVSLGFGHLVPKATGA